MNFLFYTVDYKPMPGGIAEHTHQLARHFADDGHGVVVVAPDMDGAEEFDDAQPFPVYRVPDYPVVSTLLLFFVLPVLVYRHATDVVYCPMWFPTGVFSLVTTSVTSAETVIAVHAHEVVYSEETSRKRIAKRVKPLQAWVFRTAAAVFAVSSYTKRKVTDLGVPDDHVHVIYNGVVPSEFETDDYHSVVGEENLNSQNVLLTVSRLEARKGHDTVIRALPNILEEFPDTTYIIAGSGDNESNIRKLADRIGVSDSVIFLGYVPDDELPSLYNSCDVFVMPNRREGTSVEGFGIVFLEANAAGKPVVGGDHGGARDAVVDGETGLLADPTDPDAVFDAVTDLLADETKARKMGEYGRKRCRAEFTWADIGDRMLSILKPISEEGRS